MDPSSRLYRLADRVAVGLGNLLGLTLTPARPIDLRARQLHPLDAYYLAGRRSVLMDIPVERLRGLGSSAFPCNPGSGHPFVQTLVDYRQGGIKDWRGSALEAFYHRFRPRNAAEYLGLAESPSAAALSSLGPESAVMPWDKHTPQQQRHLVLTEIGQQQRYRPKAVHPDEIKWHLCGPATEGFLEHEFRRLLAIRSSIDSRGFLRRSLSDGDIRGTVMLDDNQWAVFVRGGQHRTTALAAAGHASIPIRLLYVAPNIVRRSEVNHWPHVRSRLFAPDDALTLFDRILSGRPPFEAGSAMWRS